MAERLRFYLWIATTVVLLKTQAVALQCTANFKDELTLDGGIKGHETTIETRLIPSMRFTCNGTIVGFTVAGALSDAGPDDPRIQVWREDKEQCGSYQKLDSEIVVQRMSCSNITTRLQSVNQTRIFHCVLHSQFQVSVQYGDILGIELPPISNSDFDLYFTDGGPTNYAFQRQRISKIDKMMNRLRIVEEQPQITLDIVSDQDFHCGIGHPVEMSPGPSRGSSSSAITRLIPDLKFTCDGIITQFTVGGRMRPGSKDPMIQVWRECTNQRGTYFKPVPDIAVNATVCNGGMVSMRVFQCTLEEDFRVEVQAGDILGLELPPTDNQDFEVHFTSASGGPVNYVFQGQVLSSVELADREREVEDQPQINITLAPPATVISACERTSVCEISTTSISTTSSDSNNNTESRVATGVSVPAAVGGVIAGCIVVVIVITLLMLVIFTVWKRKQKWNIAAANGATRTNEYPMTNPIYKENTITSVTNNIGGDYDTPIDGTFDYEDIDEKEDIEPDLKPKAALKAAGPGAALPPPPQPTKGNFYTKSPGPPATHQPSYSIVDDSGNYESPVPTLPRQQGTTEGYPTEMKLNEPTVEGDYWEPADDVNELYQQLSANKYRDIKSSQIQITKALGSGQFGEVNMGIWQSPMGAMDVAVKQLQPGASEEEKVKFLKEAAINGQFRHPNVVKLMGVVSGEGSVTMIVLELLSNGDLLNFLINQRPSHGETVPVGTQQMLLRFCQHVASGMSYLASKSFIHRDLAARNILVSEDKICKISDFGMSRDVEDENYYVSKGGKVPVKWTAPEALHYKKYSTASDVWSFGCVMYEIWSLGHKPFELFSNAETVKKVDKGYILPPPPGLTKELYKIMIQCWKPESSRRPTFPQLVEMLSRADFELFAWDEEDVKDSDSQVKQIGAPLEAAQDLYPELQRLYTK